MFRHQVFEITVFLVVFLLGCKEKVSGKQNQLESSKVETPLPTICGELVVATMMGNVVTMRVSHNEKNRKDTIDIIADEKKIQPIFPKRGSQVVYFLDTADNVFQLSSYQYKVGFKSCK